MSWWREHEASQLIDKFSTSTFHTSASLWWDHTFVSSSIYRWQLALQYPSSRNYYLSVKPVMMRPIRFLAKVIFSPVGGLSWLVKLDSSGSLLLGGITWMGGNEHLFGVCLQNQKLHQWIMWNQLLKRYFNQHFLVLW